MSKEPALTPADAASLVQGEEHRLLVRLGRPGFAEPARTRVIARVARAATFAKALTIIAKAAGD